MYSASSSSSAVGGTSRRATMGRRTSTLGSSHGGTGGTGFNSVKDDRNLSDKGVQQHYTSLIKQCLVNLNFNFNNLKKAFTGSVFNPTQAEFFYIVEYIFAESWSRDFRLDRFPDKAEGVLCIAKLLKYPFTPRKSTISTLTPHNMPAIIGFVGWLAELSRIDKTSGIGPGTSTRRLLADDSEMSEINEVWQDYLTGSFKNEGNHAKTAEIATKFENKLYQIVDDAVKEAEEVEDKYNRTKSELDRMNSDIEMKEAEKNKIETSIRELEIKASDLTKKINELRVKAQNLSENLSKKTLEYERCSLNLKVASDKKDSLVAVATKNHITESDRNTLIFQRQQAKTQLSETTAILEQRAREASERNIEVERLTAGVGQKIHLYRMRRAGAFPGAAAAAVGRKSASEIDNDDRILSAFDYAQNDVFFQELNQVVSRGFEQEHSSFTAKNEELNNAIASGTEQIGSLTDSINAGKAALSKLGAQLNEYNERVLKEQEKADREIQSNADEVRRLCDDISNIKENSADDLRNEMDRNAQAAEKERREKERMEEERREFTRLIFDANKALLDHKESIMKGLEILKNDSKQTLENCKAIEYQQYQYQAQQQQQQQQRKRSLPPSAKKQKISSSPSTKKQRVN